MSVYENRFKKFLVEKDETPDVPDEMTDQQAMAQTLDKGTAPEDFDVEAPPAGAVAKPTLSAIQQKMYDELKAWTEKIDEFKKFLNDPNPDSLVSKLNAAETDTLFDKISTAETKKIARVAAELSSFNEDLKGYLATAHDLKYRYN